MMDGSALRILKCYIGANTLNFAELCKQADYPTDLGGYYIRRLVSLKYLSKTARGQYEITPQGKQLLIKLENQQGRSIAARARLCAMVVLKQGENFIVTRRKQQPYIGFVEWPAIQLLPGEAITAGAERLLASRLSTAAHLTFLGFFRRIDIYENTVFDDKLFAIHTGELDEGSPIIEESTYGTTLLLNTGELQNVEKPAQALHDVYNFIQNPGSYQERRYTLSLQDIIAEKQDK